MARLGACGLIIHVFRALPSRFAQEKSGEARAMSRVACACGMRLVEH